MVIPTQQQAYGLGTGTSPIHQFKFSESDPPTSSSAQFPLYQGWVNTVTKAIWYLEGVSYASGAYSLQWRAVGPVVTSTVTPTNADYQFPLGQTWIDTTGGTFWGLVGISGTTATWEELSSGVSSGILTLTGDSGGAVGPDGARNLNVVGTANQINVVGNPGTNTLTLSLAGGGTAADTFQVDAATAPGVNPVEPTALGLVTVTGAQVASGTTTNAVRTHTTAVNEYAIEVQRSTATGVSTVGSNGISHFNSSDFTVDSNGFVSALGSGFTRLVEVDAHTAPGTDPVAPTALGVITVTGGQVAAATTANVIQTNSLAANTYTIEVQRSKTEAVSTVGSNGVAHFNSSDFSVDADGFVSIISPPGAGINTINVQTFTANGTYTPTVNMVYCLVQMVGGGGGGGGASIDGGDTAPAGSGGGAGFYASQVFDAATIGVSKAVTIGAGGAGGVGQNDGVDGGTTALGVLLTVSGGVKGQYMRASGPVQEGGDGGQAHTGTPNYMSFGGGGQYAINVGGAVVSGAGGASLLSPGGKARAIAADGVPGGGYGGGGSGGVAAPAVPATGGAGDDGVVIITEYIT